MNLFPPLVSILWLSFLLSPRNVTTLHAFLLHSMPIFVFLVTFSSFLLTSIPGQQHSYYVDVSWVYVLFIIILFFSPHCWFLSFIPWFIFPQTFLFIILHSSNDANHQMTSIPCVSFQANKFIGSDVRIVQRIYSQPFDLHVYHPKKQPLSECWNDDAMMFLKTLKKN